MVCMVCGGPVVDSRQTCSQVCGRIIRGNTRNVRAKGRRGGFPLRTLVEIGRTLGRVGGWMTSAEIRDCLAHQNEIGAGIQLPSNTQSLSRALLVHARRTTIELDEDAPRNRWRSLGGSECLRDLMHQESYERLLSNYTHK